MSTPPIPSPFALAAELSDLLRTGMSTERLRDCSAVLSLALTHAKAASEQPDDLAVAASTLIREAATRVDDGTDGAAAFLLGLAAGSRRTLLKDRRRRAAEALHVSTEHLRKDREPLLLEAVADELYAADSAYRPRHRHRSTPERLPQRSALGVDWLEQHRSYRRIWTPLSGMRNDLYVLRGYLAAEEDQPAIADRLCNVTWHWTRFLAALERFVEDQGGLWLLADAESEIVAADAIYKIQFYVPLGETDCSWLRTLLAETPHQELDGFSDRLIEAGERRRELMAAWIAWAGCDEHGEPSDCNCPLHAWFRAAAQFIGLIDEDWYRVADYYRASDVDPSGIDIQKP